MPGTYQYDVEIKSNVAKLLSDMKQVQDRLDTVEGKEYKIKLNVDEKKLSSVISNLEKMLDSLSKGTGDFKQFENLSKELSNIVSEVQSLSKAFGKVDDSGAKTLLSSIQNIDKSLSELSQNILNVNKNMSNMGGNTGGAVKQVENISNAYQDAAKEAEKLADAQSKIGQKTNISSASTESVTNSIKEENNVLEQNTQKIKENTQAKEQNANVNLNKYDKRLDSYNGKVDKYQATIDRFNDGGWTSKTYLENVQAVKNAVHEYETLLNELEGKDASLVTSDDINRLDKYEKKIKDTIATVTNMSAAEKGYNFVSGQKELDKIHKLLAENSKMSSEAKAKIKAYYAEIESGNPSMSLDKIHGEILKIYNAEVEAGRAGRTLFDTLKNSGFHQIAAQMAGMVGVYDVINLGKEGFNVVRELNTALTEMRKVSNETVQSLKDYQATTFDTADAVGTTAKQIQNSTADWMRLGESMNQAAESAKDANVLLNVSEFEGIDEATESLVSMSQAYKDLDKMDIIDVLNNIGNNYSISTDGLATALKDSASALVTANNDLNEAVSLTTAGNAITQDPSKVGAGLRTISLRLVGTEEAKQELSDLGEETDGMITTVSKLRDTIMDATKAASSDGKGFDILDSNGNYKSTYEIMQGLADLYDNIVKKDKELGTNNLNLLLETIAGKNRANIAASILQNGDMLRSVYEDAQNSEGSAEKELNSYLDSIDGKMAQLENRAQEFWFKVIDSETIKNGIDLYPPCLKVLLIL
jgi:TP901 family phage tail tape measure protein